MERSGYRGFGQRVALLLAVVTLVSCVLAACSCDETPSAAAGAVPAQDASPDAQADASADSSSDAMNDASDGAAGWSLEDPGAAGFSFITPEFDVPAGTETARCYFVEVPGDSGSAVWIDHVKMALNPGSHELTVYKIKTIVNLGSDPSAVAVDGECFVAANWADWPVVVNTQHGSASEPFTDWQLPSGVALAFREHDLLMVRVHYVNDASLATPGTGRAGINFYYSSAANPVAVGVVHGTKQSERVCQSSPSTSVSGSCAITGGGTVIAANGQLESRGTDLEVFTWSGDASAPPGSAERFYQSTNWSDPPMALSLDTPLDSNGRIYWTCAFDWSAPAAPHSCADVNSVDRLDAGDCCYAYGQRAQTSERCDVYLYYYPEAFNILCQ